MIEETVPWPPAINGLKSARKYGQGNSGTNLILLKYRSWKHTVGNEHTFINVCKLVFNSQLLKLLKLHFRSKLLKIQAASYAKLKCLAGPSTCPYSYCRSRQHEKKQPAKVLQKTKQKQTLNVRGSQKNSMRKFCNNHNFILRSSIQTGIWSFQQNTMPSTIVGQAFYLKIYFFLNPQW